MARRAESDTSRRVSVIGTVVSRLAGGCFFGSLLAFGDIPSRDGLTALSMWRRSALEKPGTEPEAKKFERDIAAVDPADWARDWEALVTELDRVGKDALIRQLDQQLGPSVAAGFARRKARAAN